MDSARLQLRLREAPALELDTSAYTIRGGRPDTGVVLNLHGRAGTTDESFVLDECRCVADARCALCQTDAYRAAWRRCTCAFSFPVETCRRAL